MKLFLGIDGGQTAIKSILADEGGRILGTGLRGPTLHLKDEETRRNAKQALVHSVREALKQAGMSDSVEIESAFLGLTGVSGPEVSAARTYHDLAREQFNIRSVFIDHDGWNALAGAIPSMVGVIVIAGTGSIGFGMNERNETARAGGWGYLLGDQGSAYEIGRQALIAAGDSHDGIGPATQLTSLILDSLKITDASKITEAVYGDADPKLRIAGLSEVVFQAAEAGDLLAKNIFSAGGRRLGEIACAVVRKLRFSEAPVTFSAVGGVFQAGEWLWSPYREFVLSQYPKAEITHPQFPPLLGALILAFKKSGAFMSGEWLDRLESSYGRLTRSG